MEAIGRYQLGLSLAEFWALTPAQFVAGVKQLERERERELVLNARILWATFAATGRKKKSGGTWKLKDFLPKGFAEKRPTKSVKDMVALARHLNAMLGGRDRTKKGAQP